MLKCPVSRLFWVTILLIKTSYFFFTLKDINPLNFTKFNT